jgi:hypothetical protein
MKVVPTTARGRITVVHMTLSLFAVLAACPHDPFFRSTNWGAVLELVALFPLNLPYYYLTDNWDSPKDEIPFLCAVLVLNSYWCGFAGGRLRNW